MQGFWERVPAGYSRSHMANICEYSEMSKQ